jgi:ferric-dicitrate binding protein FerR (iron transport regulator)
MQQRWEANPEGFDNIEYQRIFDSLKQQIKTSNRKPLRFMQFFQRYAAAILLPLLALSTYFLVQEIRSNRPIRKEVIVEVLAEQEYLSPRGMRSRIILPDSTVVWLNADSRLTVAKGFGEQQRNVTLVGEAHFDVTKNKQRPFIVGASELDVKVLGTTFNLTAYPNEKLKVVLAEGSIEATIKNEENRALQKVVLQPDQLLEVQNQAQSINIESNVDTELYTSWIDGKLVFHKTPMEEVVKTMERWYNVTINLTDEVLKTYHFTGTLDNRSLEQVMRFICLSSSINYKIDLENHTVTIYSRKN